MRFKFLILLLSMALLTPVSSEGAFLLISMEKEQSNHLKAYGVAFWSLENQVTVEWLLNYEGGSFLIPFTPEIQKECALRNVKAEIISDARRAAILNEISRPDINMEGVKLEKGPKIA